MCRLATWAIFLCLTTTFPLQGAQDESPNIPPTATPQILQITPNQATPGAHLEATIQGKNFSSGASVASGSSAVHVDSAKRVSATQITVQLSVSDSAQPGEISLLVSNPSSGAAASTFTIMAAQPPPAPNAPEPNPEPAKPDTPAPTTEPAQPATPQTLPGNPSTPPTPEVNPPAPEPATPATPPAPAAPVELPEPVVVQVTPRKVCQGFDIDMRVAGKNFVQGTKVSFASEGIHVVGISSYSDTEITVHIKVAGDAIPGKTSLFVINPDDNEAESSIEIALKGTFAQPTPPPSSPNSPATADATYTQRFDAFHLGNPTEIFHVHGKVKGSLIISADTVKYEEDGKTLVNISLSAIKDVKTAMMGQFEIKLDSGKSIHFAAASLKGSDATAIVAAIEKAMPNPPTAD
jgi:hypothetical protein